jgi:DNA replication protein DnaC
MPRNDDVIEQLHALGFRASDDALRALFAHATKTRASPVQTCEDLVKLERRARDERNLARRTRSATLGVFKPIDRFDWSHPRSADRGLYEDLSTLAFVDQRQNVLFRGQSGVGKTTLAQNLGQAALAKGYTVRFTTLAAALGDLMKQESLPAMERRLKRYTRPDLLILDEIGYLPCDSRAADLLYNVISRRHEQRSTIITTNLAFKKWSTVFPGAACVAALVDRFVQHLHVVDIDADSWRAKDSPDNEPPLAPAKPKKPKRR